MELSALIVCRGNICRSPLAEAVLREKAKASGIALHVESAGLIAETSGKQPDEKAIHVGQQRGYSLQGLHSRTLTFNDIARFHRIYAVDKAVMADILDICPKLSRNKVALYLAHTQLDNKEIADPYQGPLKEFERTLDLIELGADGILTYLTQKEALMVALV
ncbi:low molecular weight phosphotyrosine protein phosphatase [Vibrio sp. IRLE0018]|uniref:low molecular weight protein-tyrosine-phosphatase n=1 Tax=Vibrio floridensis TaxID=2908007 RepID=UPI001F46A74E|nr:low molecular weight protein-tyrosine-phosphatase [Vibrio floridensis]MCF8780058.1 low molecular weight phosphotyrosine protein phosphatase [Vibrio floridensis]